MKRAVQVTRWRCWLKIVTINNCRIEIKLSSGLKALFCRCVAAADHTRYYYCSVVVHCRISRDGVSLTHSSLYIELACGMYYYNSIIWWRYHTACSWVRIKVCMMSRWFFLICYQTLRPKTSSWIIPPPTSVSTSVSTYLSSWCRRTQATRMHAHCHAPFWPKSFSHLCGCERESNNSRVLNLFCVPRSSRGK